MTKVKRWVIGPVASVTPLPGPLTRAAARRAAGLTLRQAAELLGTDAPTLSRWERGRQPRPPRDALYLSAIEEWLAVGDGEETTTEEGRS